MWRTGKIDQHCLSPSAVSPQHRIRMLSAMNKSFIDWISSLATMSVEELQNIIYRYSWLMRIWITTNTNSWLFADAYIEAGETIPNLEQTFSRHWTNVRELVEPNFGVSTCSFHICSGGYAVTAVWLQEEICKLFVIKWV